MTIIELKKAIETKTVPEDLIVFVCSDNHFIADQYVDAICEANNLTKVNVNSLHEQTSALSLVMDRTDELSVLKTETFDEALPDYSGVTNTVVICDKVDKKIKPFLEDYIVQVPKLAEWQIKSYMRSICQALDEDDVDWLYAAANGDVYRIINEIDKLKLFPVPEQKNVLAELRFGRGSDLYALNLFDLADALIKDDKRFVSEFLRHERDGFDLLSISGAMLQKVKNILLVTQNSGKTAAEIGISSGYEWRLRKDWANFPLTRLQSLLRFLSGLDLKLKSGLLDMPKAAQIDYLIANTIA